MTVAHFIDGTKIEIDDSNHRWIRFIKNPTNARTLRDYYNKALDENNSLSTQQRTQLKTRNIER